MTEDTTPTMRKAYELLKRGPVDPRSIYGSASGSATTNTQKSEEDDEDEEAKKQLKALALFRAQQKSRKIDPSFSVVQKEYEAVLRQVFQTQAGDNVTDTRQTSSAVPHGKDETGIASSTTKPEKVGWVSQRGPDTSSQYSTRDQPINNFSQTSIARGPGASRGAAPKGSAQSGIYPQPTRMTTAQVPGSQPKGDTWNAPYRDETPSGYSSDYNTELGSTQKVEKSILPALLIKLYETDEFGAQDHTGTMMLAELEKAAQSGIPGGAMGYQDEDIHAAGPPERMDEETKRRLLDEAKVRDMGEAVRLEEIASKLEEEAAREEPSDARLKSRTPSRKREMAEKAHEQASDLMKRWQSGQYNSGSIVKKTTRHHGVF